MGEASVGRLDVFAAGRLGNQLYFAAAAEAVRADSSLPVRVVWHGDADFLEPIRILLGLQPDAVAVDRLRGWLLGTGQPMQTRSIIIRMLFRLLLRWERRGARPLLPEDLGKPLESGFRRYSIDDFMQDRVVIKASGLRCDGALQKRLRLLLPPEVLRRLEAEQPIAVHMRFGDFLSPDVARTWGALPPTYYAAALNHLRAAAGPAPIWLFTDDAEAAKRSLSAAGFPQCTLPRDFGISTVQELALLAICSRKVLSNSTFSWWAGYLSSDDCEVVAPLPLTISGSHEAAALDEWVRLPGIWWQGDPEGPVNC